MSRSSNNEYDPKLGEAEFAHSQNDQVDDALERRISDVLREDEAMVHSSSLEAAPMTPEEAEQIAAMREAIAGEVHEAPSTDGAVLRPSRGRTALTPVPAAASAGGTPTRTHATGTHWSALHIGALAATLTMVAAAAFFALRAIEPDAEPQFGTEAPAADGGDAPTYLGGPEGGAASPTDAGSQGAEDEARGPLETLPDVVDWQDAVDSAGPFLVIIRDVSRPRLDESREIEELEDIVYDTTWSCAPDQHDLLPDVFWVEVYVESDPPGSRPVWSQLYARP